MNIFYDIANVVLAHWVNTLNSENYVSTLCAANYLKKTLSWLCITFLLFVAENIVNFRVLLKYI